MRPIEALLLLADLLAFVALAARLPPAMGWMRHVAPIALLLGLSQALVEGPRWQMAPAYALTGVFVLAWLSQREKTSGERKLINRLGAGAAIALGGLALAFGAFLPLAFPVFRFPHPTGPYAIGTLTYHWVDASRSEIFTADPNDHRELVVQVWYPAAPNASPRARYMPDADVVTTKFARIQRIPEFIFGHFKYVTTNAVSAAPMSSDRSPYAVLIFLEGATGFRQMNTFQVEELVSRGYVVVAIDQPGVAADVVFPGGRQIATLPIAQLMGVIRPSYMPNKRASQLNGRALEGGSVIPYLTQDVAFTLDRLAAVNEADPNDILTGRLDLQHVGAFGFSLGGIVVGEACHREVRLRACLIIDAPMPFDVVAAGLRQPSMWITRPAASMRLERQRWGGWPEAEIEAHQTSMRAVYQSLLGEGYFVQIPGTFHSNFADVPNWFPLASQFGIAGPIDGQRAHAIINAYSVAFFDQHLKGRPANLLQGPSRQYPEVLLESRRH